MQEFLDSFVSTNQFIPHGHCYLWKAGLVWLHIISDSSIALAYYGIPAMLIYFVRQRRDVPFDWIFLLFSTFIIACGTTHVMEIWTLWYPTYWFSGLLKAITALVSLSTAVVLAWLIPQALNLVSPAQLEAVNQALLKTEKALCKEKELLNTLLYNLEAGIVACDAHGVLTMFNAASREFHGLPEQPLPPEAWGKQYNLYLVDGKTPMRTEDVPLWRALQGEKVRNVEMVIVPKLGKVRTVLTSGQAIVDAQGEKLGAVVAMHDITERKQAEAVLQASLQEKEVLLKEIHHRVKNNLQIISGLLYLQGRYVEDEKTLQVLQENRDRIQSMALVHEKLYGSKNLDEIEFPDYINSLTHNLFISYGVNQDIIALKCLIEPVSLKIDIAIPCGLIINELVSNALKHAFPLGEAGEIIVKFYQNGENSFELIVSDNGVGFTEQLDLKNKKSLGLRLVHSLATKQLEGTIEVDGSRGAKFKICLRGVPSGV